MALRSSPVPEEIWTHVAQFIPDTSLRWMFSINRAFFQLAMDARYREVRFDFDSSALAFKRLRRVRDPLIAHRVRCLYVDLVYSTEFFQQFSEEGDNNPGWISTSLQHGIQIMTETVTCLTNITEFSVQWTEFPAREHLIPLLTAAWKSFGSGLRKLSFRAPLNYLAALLSTADGLISLRDLEVMLCRELMFTQKHDEALPTSSAPFDEALATVLAPFVNKIAPTLHSLSFTSYMRDLKLSPFFHHLGKIPNLERLCIFIDDDVQILSEPLGLNRFICNHATTLRHFKWDAQYSRSSAQPWMDWLTRNNLDEVFSNLCTLLMPVPVTPGGFSRVAQYIRCSAGTLTSLGLLGYDMTFDEVQMLVSLFMSHSSGNLKELNLRAEFLSPELVLLLAQSLPSLGKLTIQAMHLTGHEVGKRTSEAINADNYECRSREERLNAGIFANTMRTYNICDWRLHDIGLEIVDCLDTDLREKLMWVLAECVPSVQRFSGIKKELYAIHADNRL